MERVLSYARRYRRPVYIELPRDIVSSPLPILPLRQNDDVDFQTSISEEYKTDIASMQEALEEAARMINSSRQPVIVAGVEIHRFGLQDKILQLVGKTNIPVVSTVLSKSVINEDHPCYLGVYEGAMGFQSVKQYVKSSDCLILLGALMTDINFGISPTPIKQSRSIYISNEKLSIKHHNYEDIVLSDFLASLIDLPLERRMPKNIEKFSDKSNIHHRVSHSHFEAKKDQRITVKHLFERLNFSITGNTIIIADVGDSLFGALDLTIHGQTEFLSPAYYLSMGFAVPAAIGTQLANPKLRPIVIIGDGAFQMTGMKISTIARFGLNPIIIVLNNKGYGTERPMLDGPFNDILPWNYSQVPRVLNHGKGFVIETEDQLEESLSHATGIYSNECCILDVRLESHDGSPALHRLIGQCQNVNDSYYCQQ